MLKQFYPTLGTDSGALIGRLTQQEQNDLLDTARFDVAHVKRSRLHGWLLHAMYGGEPLDRGYVNTLSYTLHTHYVWHTGLECFVWSPTMMWATLLGWVPAPYWYGDGTICVLYMHTRWRQPLLSVVHPVKLVPYLQFVPQHMVLWEDKTRAPYETFDRHMPPGVIR
jgi:hypothetical protein